MNVNVEPAPLLQEKGELKTDTLGLHRLGENKPVAVRILDKVGWR